MASVMSDIIKRSRREVEGRTTEAVFQVLQRHVRESKTDISAAELRRIATDIAARGTVGTGQ
jgi:uncharacterized protein (DUF2267 family)